MGVIFNIGFYIIGPAIIFLLVMLASQNSEKGI